RERYGFMRMRRHAIGTHAVNEIDPITFGLVLRGHFREKIAEIRLRGRQARAQIHCLQIVFIWQNERRSEHPSPTPTHVLLCWNLDVQVSSARISKRFTPDGEWLQP